MSNSLALAINFPKYKIIPRVILGLEVVLFLLLLILYIFHIQAIIKAEYQLNHYQQALQKLTKDSQSLQARASSLSSLEKAEKIAKASGFVKVKTVKYLPLTPGSLARNPK